MSIEHRWTCLYILFGEGHGLRAVIDDLCFLYVFGGVLGKKVMFLVRQLKLVTFVSNKCFGDVPGLTVVVGDMFLTSILMLSIVKQ